MSTATAQQPTTAERGAPPAAPSWESTCLNCGSGLASPYCGECGQRAVPPHPTLRELFGEAFAEFSGWDGKFAGTIRTLLSKPGQLTLEFLAGRRAKFISPLRLYLTASLVYFLLAEMTPAGKGPYIGIRPPAGAVSAGSKSDATGLTAEDRAAIQEQLSSSPKWLQPLVRRAAENPKQLQSDVFQALPKALFALLPVFALILMPFYRGRRFADHLYFAIHVHAFVFVALILNDLTKFAGMAWLSLISGIVVLFWLPLYGHLALGRVYAGSQMSTFLKELGIGILYAAASIPMVFLLALWVAGHSP